MSVFRFKQFSVRNETSALKVGTDAVVLGAYLSLEASDRCLLDIGTGTGVIALLAAQRLSELKEEAFGGGDFGIEGLDIDEPSAAEAKLNFEASPWSKHLRAFNLALRDYTPSAPLDCIFSNPPYYDESLKNPDQRKGVARHTESLSYREICAFASKHLAPEGRLSLILPSDCEKTLLRTAASFGLFPFRLVRIQTTARKAPIRIIAEFKQQKTASPSEETVNLQQPNLTALYYL